MLKDDRWPGAWSDCSFDPHTQCTHTHKLYINIFPPVLLSTHCTLEFISFSHQPSITLPTRLPTCPSITSINLRISLSALHLFLTGYEPGVPSVTTLNNSNYQHTAITKKKPMSDNIDSQTSSEDLFKHKEATFPHLNTSNYATWSKNCKHLLQAIDVWSIVSARTRRKT